MQEERTCFVAMPFSEEMQPIYEKIYKPVIESCGLQPVRVDTIFRPGLITKDIFDSIAMATIVLVDLTGANPNVYYELGIAHRERKPVILTAQSIVNDIRFDVKALRVIEYLRGKEDFWADQLREGLTKAINETLSNPAIAIATPWLGPLHAAAEGGATTPMPDQIQQLIDLVTSVHTMVSKLSPEDSPQAALFSDWLLHSVHPTRWSSTSRKLAPWLNPPSDARWLDLLTALTAQQLMGGAHDVEGDQRSTTHGRRYDAAIEPEKGNPSAE